MMPKDKQVKKRVIFQKPVVFVGVVAAAAHGEKFFIHFKYFVKAYESFQFFYIIFFSASIQDRDREDKKKKDESKELHVFTEIIKNF